MSDREKVIKGLECCNSTSCQKCPYNEKKECNERGFFYSQAIEDAIQILKEQEAKTGTWQWKIHGKPESGGTLGEAVCDQCGKSTYATAVKGTLNYCPNCVAKATAYEAYKNEDGKIVIVHYPMENADV